MVKTRETKKLSGLQAFPLPYLALASHTPWDSLCMQLFFISLSMLVILTPYEIKGKKFSCYIVDIKNRWLDAKFYPKMLQLPLGYKVILHLLIKEVLLF